MDSWRVSANTLRSSWIVSVCKHAKIIMDSLGGWGGGSAADAGGESVESRGGTG